MDFDDLANELDAAGERAVNLSPILDKFVQVMDVSIQKNFDAEGRPTKWAPLAQPHPGHQSMLYDTGALRQSAKASHDGHDVILTAGGNGQPPAKAPALQYGAQLHNKRRVTTGRFVTRRSYRNVSSGGGYLPPRPYLVFQPEDLAYLGDELPSYIIMSVKF